MSTLYGLSQDVRPLVCDPSFRTGTGAPIDAGPFLIEDLGLGRGIALDPLQAEIAEVRRRFSVAARSDAWLAPRVHATLRLTRREAADKRLWNYLTVVEFADYVRWRFLDDDQVPVDRFLGEDSKNALARLWWAAELTRNGADYRPTEQALARSQFARSWLALDALHYRPAALAVAGFLADYRGMGTTDTQGQVLAKAFNVALRTVVLDDLWQAPATDAEVLRQWCRTPEGKLSRKDELPTGPDEAPVPEAAIAAVRAVLERLAAMIKLCEVKSPRRRARASVEEEVALAGSTG